MGASSQLWQLYQQGRIPLDTYLANLGNDSGDVSMRGGASSLDRPYAPPTGAGEPVIPPFETTMQRYTPPPPSETVPDPSMFSRVRQLGRGSSEQLRALYESGMIPLDTYLANAGNSSGDVRLRGGGSSLDIPSQQDSFRAMAQELMRRR